MLTLPCQCECHINGNNKCCAYCLIKVDKKEKLWMKILDQHYILTLIVLVVGFTIIGIHVWYENTTRSEHWIEEMKSETVCENLDNAISWGDRPFVEKMVKFAEQRKEELKCP